LVIPKPAEDFVFGLQNREAEEYRSVLRLHLVPIKRILLLMGQSAVGLRDRWKGRARMASNLSAVQMPKKLS
jgi:hypothetical protein